VIVCHIEPGSEGIVGGVFGHYDSITRPQDLGVIGRSILSHHDLYIHILDRKQDPAISGQQRGLPAFQQIAEEIGPYVTPYPSYWSNPSDSVAKPFYGHVSSDVRRASEAEQPQDTTVTTIVGRMTPGTEQAIAEVFAEHDAGDLPARLGVVGRWLYAIDDVYVHLLQQDTATADALRDRHDETPGFQGIMQDLADLIGPYRSEGWTGPQDSVATVFYRWDAPGLGRGPGPARH
jgi:hypothetical protein